MPPTRRIALMTDLDRPDARQRAALRGVCHFAEEHPCWQLILDPFAATHPTSAHDGILILSDPTDAARTPPPDIPVVAVGHPLWHRRTLSRVVPNLRTAGRLAAHHLLKCGFSRFAFFGTMPDMPVRFLHEGYRCKIDRAGFSLASMFFHPHSLAEGHGWTAIHAAIAQWLHRRVEPPAGVFASAPLIARTVADICLHNGLRIPEDIALITPADDSHLIRFPAPPLTTIDLGYERAGHRAAHVLNHMLDTGATSPRRTLLAPGDIMARRSTGIVTWRDPLVQRACRHIAEHCTEPLRVADIAAAMGVSVRTLERTIRHRHPRSIVGEIAHARLQHAKRLLLASDLPVEDVARQAGFTSGRVFARLLRRADGLTPTAYRQLRPPPPAADAPDFKRAKQLLATTTLSIGTVAHITGYRAHRYLIAAFHRHEHTTPRAWRKEHRERPPRGRRAPVSIVFIGPDGEIEQEW